MPLKKLLSDIALRRYATCFGILSGILLLNVSAVAKQNPPPTSGSYSCLLYATTATDYPNGPVPYGTGTVNPYGPYIYDDGPSNYSVGDNNNGWNCHRQYLFTEYIDSASRPDQYHCDYCGDHSDHSQPGAEWMSTIGLDTAGDAMQVRCPGCDSAYPGEPAFYHGVCFGQDTGAYAFASISADKDNLGGPLKAGTGAGARYIFEGTDATDFGNPGEWEKISAATAGTIPGTLGIINSTLFTNVFGHKLDLPCCSTGRDKGDGRKSSASSSGGGNTTINDISSISVYPNPANTMLYFSFPMSAAATIRISDITGRLMDQQVLQNSASAVFNVAGYVPGIYIYQVITNGVTQSGKIVINR